MGERTLWWGGCAWDSFAIPQLVDDMVEKGVSLVIANSDDMKDGTREAAHQHPKVHFLHISGDDVLTGKGSPNLSNLMGRMEYTKMMAGFAAALTTKTGKIGYLGPLINEETRRLAASAYLGAKYAWENVLKKKASDLKFQVTWIGFWFNIPGVTTDPTQVAQNFINTGYDVIISGIDTTEALTVAKQKKGRQSCGRYLMIMGLPKRQKSSGVPTQLACM
jgi:simple sugar transport system substrate-binding protein